MTALLLLIGWLIWSLVCAAGLRVALATAGRLLGLSNGWAIFAAWLGVVPIFAGSYVLHQAILGPSAMYGGPRETFSLIAYLLAPFGLPLLVGGFLFLIIDLGRTALSDFARGQTA
jgi:hypothetical protein